MAPDDLTLLPLIGTASLLCLDVAKQDWDDACGFSWDEAKRTLYFPVSRKYLQGRDLERYQVAIQSQPPLIVTGQLAPATTDDVAKRLQLMLSKGWAEEAARYALFNKRSGKPRANNYKLMVSALREG